MAEDKDPKTGRFLPGNQLAKNLPHTIVVSADGLRDQRGHFLPGCTGNGRGNHPESVYAKKLALQEATTPEMVKEAILGLYNLAKTSGNDFVKLAAWNMFLDRTIGKPAKEIQIDKRVTKVSADFSSMSTEQLQALEAVIRDPMLAATVVRQVPLESEQEIVVPVN